MAEETPPQQRSNMSLVPYIQSDSQAIVLRHGSAVVLYDHQSRQISLGRDSSNTTPPDPNSAISRAHCPTCHRPYHDSFDHDLDPATEDQHEATFTDPEYFQLLHRSLPQSQASTQPPSPRNQSPRRRLPLAASAADQEERQTRAERHTSREATLRPPDGAEFIGSAPVPSETAHGISTEAFSPEYFRRFFIVERELGRGGKGVVFLVKHILDDVFLGRFACKRVPVGNDHEWLKKVLVEVQLLTNLAHPNLVQYKHVWLEDFQISNFGPSVPCAFILQQYCNAGDLHNYMLDSARTNITTQQLKDRIRRRSKGQSERPDDLHGPRRMQFEEIFSFFKDITAGLHHLHANGYIHRDLKPSNCLLHRNATGHLRVLVSDFGEVQVVSDTRKSTGGTGTISYCAPEVLHRDKATGNLGNFTTKSDIFSLGMIVYFMCFGRLPYKSADQMEEDNEDIEQLRAEISAWVGFDDHEKKRSDLPDRLYKFLKRLLSIDPGVRPSTDDILQNIGAGSDLDDLGISNSIPHPHVFDDMKSRFSTLDTPSPTPQRMPSERRNSNLHLVGTNGHPLHHKRHGSTRMRPTSPTKPPLRKADESTHAAYVEDSDSDVFSDAQMESSVILRARNAKQGDRSTPGSPSRSSPRQLLIEPPPTLFTRISRLFSDSFNIGALKVLLFVLKFISLFQPCAPLAPRAVIMYPLLALAALDFVLSQHGEHDEIRHAHARQGFRISAILLLLHLAVILLAGWWDGLCPARPGITWE